MLLNVSEGYLYRYAVLSIPTKDAALTIGDRAEQYCIIQGTPLKMHVRYISFRKRSKSSNS